MKYLFALLFLIAITPLKSQSFWLKGYGGLGREPRLQLQHNLEPSVYVNSSRSSTGGFFMPAIVIENRQGDFFEIGFSWANAKTGSIHSAMRVPPSDSIQLVDLGATKFGSFDLQLEYNIAFRKSRNERSQAFLGFGLNPHWSKMDYTTHQTYLYSIQSLSTGVNWGVIPRIQYKWTKNLVIDINTAIFLLSTNYAETSIQNPALTSNQQTNSLFEIDFLPQIWLRAGLAWRILGEKTKE